MSSHPKFFEKKFVGCSGKITNQEVKDLIRTAIPPGTNQVKLELLQAIGLFIDQSTEEGETIAFVVKYIAILNYIHHVHAFFYCYRFTEVSPILHWMSRSVV